MSVKIRLLILVLIVLVGAVLGYKTGYRMNRFTIRDNTNSGLSR